MIEDKKMELGLSSRGMFVQVPKGKVMKAADVRFAWNTDEDGRISAFFSTDEEKPWKRNSGKYAHTGGAVRPEWLVSKEKRSHESFSTVEDEILDPAGLFGTLMAAGFSDRAMYRTVLIGFAKIDECEWARRMLYAVDGVWQKRDLARPL